MADNGDGCNPINCCLAFVIFWFVMWLLGQIFLWGPLFSPPTPTVTTQTLPRTVPKTSKCKPPPPPVVARKPSGAVTKPPRRSIILSPEPELPPEMCPTPTLGQPSGAGNCITVESTSPDLHYKAWGRRDGTVELVTVSFHKIVWISYGRENGNVSVSSVAFSPDGRVLATSDKNGQVILWLVRVQVAGKPYYWRLRVGRNIDYVQFADNHTLIVRLKGGGVVTFGIQIWRAQDGVWKLKYSTGS